MALFQMASVSQGLSVTTPADVWGMFDTVVLDLILFCMALMVSWSLRGKFAKPRLKKEPKVPVAPLTAKSKIEAVGPEAKPAPLQHGSVLASILAPLRSVASPQSANAIVQRYLVARSEPLGGTAELYAKMVQCAVRAGRADVVLLVVDDMIRDSVPRSLGFYEAAIKQIAKQKEHELALQLYDRLAAEGLQPSSDTLSCLVSFALQVGDCDRAITFFGELSAMTTPSIRAYMTLLRVHAQRQDWGSMLLTFRDMESRLASADSLALNVTLAAGVATDNFVDVETLFNDIVARKPDLPDVVSYNTVLKGYARRGDVTKALELLDTMIRSQSTNQTPNAITFNTVMDAAMKASLPSKAWDVLARAQASGFKPDQFTCSILIKGTEKCATAGELYVSRCADLLRKHGKACDVKLRTALFSSLLSMASEHDTSLMEDISGEVRRQNLTVQTHAER